MESEWKDIVIETRRAWDNREERTARCLIITAAPWEVAKMGTDLPYPILTHVHRDVQLFGLAYVERTIVEKRTPDGPVKYTKWVYYPAESLTMRMVRSWEQRPGFTKHPTVHEVQLAKLAKTYNDFEWKQDTSTTRQAIKCLREEIELYAGHHRLPYPSLKEYMPPLNLCPKCNDFKDQCKCQG